MLLPAFVFGVLAFVVCSWTVPLVRRAAEHRKLYDLPGVLKLHCKPVPRVGGVAMMVSLWTCLLVAQDLDGLGLCLLAFSIVWAVGLVDDIKSLSPLVRLGSHLIAGGLLWIGGWRLQWTANTSLDLMFTSLFVAFLINSMNLFDGMDGLAAGTAAIAAAGFLWLLYGSSELPPKIVAWSLLGMCLGVLLHNFPPARIFMGDSGSTLVGIVLAFLALAWIRAQPESHTVTSPLILIGLPVVDAFLAVFRRLRSRRSPFSGDRRHFYDLLLQRGWSVGKVLTVSWGATAVLVMLAWIRQREPNASLVVIAIIAAFFSFVAHVLGSLRIDAVSGSPRPIPSLSSILRVDRP